MTSRIAFTSLTAALAWSALGSNGPAATLSAQDSPPVSRKAAAVERLATDAALRAAAADARLEPVALTDAGIVPGMIAVKFIESMDPATMGALAADHGASRIARPAFADFHLVSVGRDDDAVAIARALAAEPGVVYAEPVGRIRALYRPNDPLYQY